MTARPLAAAMVLASLLLAVGCSAGPTRPAILDRERTSADALPAGIDGFDDEASRYAGEDSAGNGYWAAVPADGAAGAPCIVVLPAGQDDAVSFCGGVGVTARFADVTVELATDPRSLSPDNAELVGDTFLVDVG